MAKFWLINSVIISGIRQLPGDEVDDAVDAIAPYTSAGAFLFPQGNATVDAAAAQATNAHKNRGANEQELENIMQTAVDFVQGTASPTPATRTLTAGTGLTGGGDLTADRTFNVIANADGSIVANANDIQVGVLATDAQHGVRGGGTQHAVATTGAAGFLSAADKTRLDTMQAGTGTLVAGTATIAANITALSRIQVTMKDPGAGAITGFAAFKVPAAARVVGAPGSFDVTAIDDAKATIATAVCTFDWHVEN